MDCTCAELTGSGSDATAASRAFFMMLKVSGEKEPFGKTISSQVNLDRILEGNVTALNIVKSFQQSKKT